MKTVTLGELVDFYSGGTPSKANPNLWNGDVPWFSAKDMKRDRLSDSADHVSAEAFRSTSLRKLPAGTIAMVVRGMILAHTVPIAILDVEAAINQDLKALLPRRDVVPSFLAAMLRAQHETILAQVSTAAHGTKKLDSRILEGISIPVPPLDEQRRISAILDQAGALRAKRRQALAHIDNLTQSIFLDMFGNYAWKTPLEDLATVQIGPFGSLLHKDDYISDGVALINPMHIVGGRLNPDPTFSVSTDKASELSRYRLHTGDLVLGRRGEMGRCGEALPEHAGLICGTGSVIVRPLPARARSRFLHAVLTQPRMKAHLERESLGATLPNLNSAIVNCAPAPLVDLSDQLEFEARLGVAAKSRQLAQESCRVVDELFSSLQSSAFRGDL